MKKQTIFSFILAVTFAIVSIAQPIPTTGYQVQAAARRAFNQSTIFNDSTKIADLRLPNLTDTNKVLGVSSNGRVVLKEVSGGGSALWDTSGGVFSNTASADIYKMGDTNKYVISAVDNDTIICGNVTYKLGYYSRSYSRMFPDSTGDYRVRINDKNGNEILTYNTQYGLFGSSYILPLTNESYTQKQYVDSLFSTGGGGSQVDETGGKYGVVFNGNNAAISAPIGLARGVGVGKSWGRGYVMNMAADLSPFGSPTDTAVLFLGVIDTTDFSGTNLQIGKTFFNVETDSFFKVRANSYRLENLPTGSGAYNVTADASGYLYKTTHSGGGGNVILDTIIVLDDTVAIQQMGTNPIQLLPAISGKAYNIVNAVLSVNFAGNPYDFSTDISISVNYGGVSAVFYHSDINGSYSSIQKRVGVDMNLTQNFPVMLLADSSTNATQGNSPITVHLYYTKE